MKNNFRQRASDRRGAMLPLVAVMLTILLGCVAFGVDIAYMQLVKVELKSSVDFSARAAGEALTRMQSLDDAKAAARNMASLNLVAGDPLLLEDADIVPGHSLISQSTGRWIFFSQPNTL